jgi:hypothetical protein
MVVGRPEFRRSGSGIVGWFLALTGRAEERVGCLVNTAGATQGRACLKWFAALASLLRGQTIILDYFIFIFVPFD